MWAYSESLIQRVCLPDQHELKESQLHILYLKWLHQDHQLCSPLSDFKKVS